MNTRMQTDDHRASVEATSNKVGNLKSMLPRTRPSRASGPDVKSRRALTKTDACDHAWVLNIKPAVCLWCGARRQSRK